MSEEFNAITEALKQVENGQVEMRSSLDTLNNSINNDIPEAFRKALTPDKVDNPSGSGEKPAEEKVEMKSVEMERAGLASWEVWDIPVGQAVIGGTVAVFLTELIDGFMTRQSNMVVGLVKLVGAGAAVKWGSGALGQTGAKAVALLMAFDGVKQILPLDTFVKRAANSISGTLTTAGLGGVTYEPGFGGNVLEEANQVAANKFQETFGR